MEHRPELVVADVSLAAELFLVTPPRIPDWTWSSVFFTLSLEWTEGHADLIGLPPGLRPHLADLRAAGRARVIRDLLSLRCAHRTESPLPALLLIELSLGAEMETFYRWVVEAFEEEHSCMEWWEALFNLSLGWSQARPDVPWRARETPEFATMLEDEYRRHKGDSDWLRSLEERPEILSVSDRRIVQMEDEVSSMTGGPGYMPALQEYWNNVDRLTRNAMVERVKAELFRTVDSQKLYALQAWHEVKGGCRLAFRPPD